jgi:hypothetical protein
MPDLVFVHVAVATMELQAGVENVSLQFSAVRSLARRTHFTISCSPLPYDLLY